MLLSVSKWRRILRGKTEMKSAQKQFSVEKAMVMGYSKTFFIPEAKGLRGHFG